MRFVLPLVVVVAFVLSKSSSACTAVSVPGPDGPVVAKTLDWPEGHGMLFLNKRGVRKKALLFNPLEKRAEWTSKYASFSFNQVSREFPYEGMNEAGLSVDILILKGTQPPRNPRRLPSIDESQWIQYMLDSAATVDDAVNLDRSLHLAPAYAPVHYFVCDRTGACAVFEHLGHELVLHTGESLSPKVLTNSTYEESLAYLGTLDGFGGTSPIPADSRSLSRFARAAAALRRITPAGGDVLEQLFGLLREVYDPESTQWSIVFDLGARKLSFETRSQPERRSVSFEGFDLGCKSGIAEGLDLDSRGDFAPYTPAMNAALARKSRFLPAFLRGIGSRYPERSTKCVQ